MYEVFPSFSICGKAKRNSLRPLSRAKALKKLRRDGSYVSSYAGALPLQRPKGKTRCKKDVIKESWEKKLCSVACFVARTFGASTLAAESHVHLFAQ